MKVKKTKFKQLDLPLGHIKSYGECFFLNSDFNNKSQSQAISELLQNKQELLRKLRSEYRPENNIKH